MIETSTLHSRQHQLIAQGLRDANVLIYGAGMLGSWTAHALARVAHSITVFDGEDTVEDVNIGTQAYTDMDIGQPKGEALAMHIGGLPNYDTVPALFPNTDRRPVTIWGTPDIVVACADSMEARARGSEWCYRKQVPLFIDTRARGLEATVITVSGDQEYREYASTLPTDDEIDDVPCGQNGTAFVGMFVASRVASICNIFMREGIANLPKQESWNVERGLIITRVEREVEREEVEAELAGIA